MNDQLQGTLTDLARKLGTSVDRVWPLLIAKERMDWIASACVALLFIGVSVMLHRIATKDGDKYDLLENGWSVFASIGWLLSLCLVCYVISNVGSLIYPEAGAIQSLVALGAHK